MTPDTSAVDDITRLRKRFKDESPGLLEERPCFRCRSGCANRGDEAYRIVIAEERKFRATEDGFEATMESAVGRNCCFFGMRR